MEIERCGTRKRSFVNTRTWWGRRSLQRGAPAIWLVVTRSLPLATLFDSRVHFLHERGGRARGHKDLTTRTRASSQGECCHALHQQHCPNPWNPQCVLSLYSHSYPKWCHTILRPHRDHWANYPDRNYRTVHVDWYLNINIRLGLPGLIPFVPFFTGGGAWTWK